MGDRKGRSPKIIAISLTEEPFNDQIVRDRWILKGELIKPNNYHPTPRLEANEYTTNFVLKDPLAVVADFFIGNPPRVKPRASVTRLEVLLTYKPGLS